MSRFDDLHDYVTIPRLTSLRLAPDGSWLAAVVQEPDSDGKKYVNSIWRIDTAQPASGQPASGQPASGQPASGQPGSGQPGSGQPASGEPGSVRYRLTRSAGGEDSPEFLPDGALLFLSKRPEPGAAPHRDGDPAVDKTALWLLPARGGEAVRVAAPPGGVARLATAASARSVVLTSPMLPGTADAGQDAERRTARKDAGVVAILHEQGPVRFWDHDLGPDCLRLLAIEIADPAAGDGAGDAAAGDAAAGDAAAAEPRPVTPEAGRALDEHSFELTPDGGLAVTGWTRLSETGEKTDEVIVIDMATGERRTLLGQPGCDYDTPRISPDGRLIVCRKAWHDSYEQPGVLTLVVAALDGEPGPRDLLAGLDRRPAAVAWAPDSGSVYFTADDDGRRPVFAASLATGQVTRLTADHGFYDSLCPAPDGRYLYALRSAVDCPPVAVRIDVTAAGPDPVQLAGPAGQLELPGRLEEVAAAADDGVRISGWLVLPDAASASSPAPLLLWVHGGPVMSWNNWSWRWNPWLMAARGYAVLLPNPALSDGYGHDFIARGYSQWGDRPYRDLMAITDAVIARPDIDASRTAMMGASYGGYMANWIAGHTSRFAAIVSHAGLWALDQMFGTTDLPSFWRKHFGDPIKRPERYQDNSPHLHADAITTPMLIIHGDKDYRVPIGEALRLWWDLASRGNDAKFLYFPDQNHWILSPGSILVWYQTVLAFLAQHVHGEPWRRPDLL